MHWHIAPDKEESVQLQLPVLTESAASRAVRQLRGTSAHCSGMGTEIPGPAAAASKASCPSAGWASVTVTQGAAP